MLRRQPNHVPRVSGKWFLLAVCAFLTVAAAYSIGLPASTPSPATANLNMNGKDLANVGDVIARGPQVDVRALGAIPNDELDDTAAFQAAIDKYDSILVPEGTYHIRHLNIGRSGVSLVGVNPTKTILKGTISTAPSSILSISAPSRWVIDIVIKNLTFDMRAMQNSADTYGLYTDSSYGNHLENIRAASLPKQTVMRLYKTFTTTLNGARFHNIALDGPSMSDATTTITLINCDLATAKLTNAVSITFIQPVFQGTEDKLVLNNVDNISLFGGDIEGSGTYLKCGEGVRMVTSVGNCMEGFSGTYKTGNLQRAYLADGWTASKPYYTFSDGAMSLGGNSASIVGAGTGRTPKLYVENPSGHATDWVADLNNASSDPGQSALRLETGNPSISTYLLLGVSGKERAGRFGVRSDGTVEMASCTPPPGSAPPAGHVWLFWDDAAKRFKYKDSTGKIGQLQ